ncbi:endogenous retrovirus group K member 8 Gag polyprotein-like [Globicephala melas]|uniref:endogenous retrovirus group K member 8 Gag polyprotein-like n=1 Tax=Globicephala melas TaxID=9731 RepID=UPI00293D4696|nr:endogenous retrovirus group K member 8 Gag polyprotein-like [Globicephala melas]
MGNTHVNPTANFYEPIQALLRDRGLMLSHKTIGRLLNDIDQAAPWFGVSGTLTIPSWEKLGKDLHRFHEEGKLCCGTFPLWNLVRSCLKEGKCTDIVKQATQVLRSYQDSASEAGSHKATDDRPTKEELVDNKVKKKLKSKQPDAQETGREPMYLLLSGLQAMYLSDDEELDPGDAADLAEAAAKYEEERYGPFGALPPSRPQEFFASKSVVQPRRSAPSIPSLQCTFIPREAWFQIPSSLSNAFPVFEDPATRQRYYDMIDHKLIRDLAEASKRDGISANYTIMLLQRLTRNALTPTDWQDIARACLTMGQYLDWKSIVSDLAHSQARENAANGQPAWNVDMLLGQGQWINNQTMFPVQVYNQINEINMRAWRALPNKGEVSGNLTKIIQGGTEPFSDFVARMMEAAGRIFGNVDEAMPLVKQLVYEQCTKECRRAITPFKGKDIEVWMKACREIGGPLSNAGLAAAVMTAAKGMQDPVRSGNCFHCGKPGHLKKQCRMLGAKPKMSQSARPPGTCPRCKKGKHWANECKSVKDINGQPFLPLTPSKSFQPTFGNAQSKNGLMGPRSQGPKIFGAHENVNLQPPKPRGEPRQAPQGWTSVPPPEWY